MRSNRVPLTEGEPAQDEPSIEKGGELVALQQITKRQLAGILAISPETVMRRAKRDPEFPQPVDQSEQVVTFFLRDAKRYLLSRQRRRSVR